MPPAGFWDKTSSEDSESVEDCDATRNGANARGKAAVRPSTPIGFFNLMFSDTKTQPPPPQRCGSDNDDK